MSICDECGGVGVHHSITCSHSPKPPSLPPSPSETKKRPQRPYRHKYALGAVVTTRDGYPGVIIGYEEKDYRILVGLPGEHGHVAAYTLRADEVW